MSDRHGPPEALGGALLDEIRRLTGFASPQSGYEDETVEFISSEPGTGDTLRVRFRYRYDEDPASQYDRTFYLGGEAVCDRAGHLCDLRLWREHIGEATVQSLPAHIGRLADG